MSFELLPPTLLIDIFHQLPFKDRVLLAGVNRSFRDASDESIYRMKSLDVTDYLVTYSLMYQPLSSLLESSSSTLRSIDATNPSSNKIILRMMADFVYPKLDRLQISVIDYAQTTKLISRCPNVRSIVLYTSGKLEWPKNIVFEKLEKLEIYSSEDCRHFGNLSKTIMPLIGNAPNLKKLTIESGEKCRFHLKIPKINLLVAFMPSLEELNIYVYKRGSDVVSPNCVLVESCFTADIPSRKFPKLKMSVVLYGFPGWPSTLQQFSTKFPPLNLHELHLRREINKAELVDIITNIPSIAILKIWAISNANCTGAFIEFLTSTATIFRRKLEIRLDKMIINGFKLEFEQMISRLEEMKSNGGPVVEVKRGGHGSKIESIHYMSLDG